MAIGTPVPQEDLHPSVYVPQATSNVVPAEDMSGSNSAAATESSTLQPEAAYPAVGAGAALAAQGAGRAVGSKNWFNSDFPEYRPSEPNPLPKNPGEFTDGTYKPGSPYSPGVYAPGKPYAPGPEFVRREFPGLPAELDKGPNAVENFALSQHKGPAGEGQFFGGQDYGDAYARAMEAKQFNAGSTGFVVPQGGTPLALPPEIATQKEQEYKAKLEAERAQREEGARVIHEQQEDKRQAEHNRAEAARRQAHEDREAHRLKTFNDIERQRRDNHAAMEQEKQNRFLTSESERQGAHASRQAEYQLARRAEDARMAQEANQIAKSKLIGMANKLPGQIPLAGWNAGEAAERFQEPGIRNKIAGAVNAAGAVAPFLSHVPKIGKYAGLIGPGAAGLAHLIADEPQGHKAGGHIQHFGRGGQPNQGGPMTADRVINDVKSFGEPLTALGDTLASGLRSSTAATLGGLPDLYNLASAATGDRLGHAPYGSEELKQMFPEVTNDPERMNSSLVKMASAAGDWTPLAGPGEIARGIKGVGKLAGSEINKAMMGEGNSMLRAVTPQPMFAAPTSRTSGLVPAEKAANFLFKPRETKILKASEALAPYEGKFLGLTQTDNFGVHGGRMGGNQFPNFQNISPLHQQHRVVWMNDSPKHAQDIINRGGDNMVWSTYIGAPDQLKSNKSVAQDILNQHYQRDLSPEQIDLINQRIATLRAGPKKNLVFSQPFDIRDKFAAQELGLDTFARRAALADILGTGKGVGLTKGGIALPQYEDILRAHRDPLTEGAPTSSVGTRLFTVDPTIPTRHTDQFHPDYRDTVHGDDLGVQFNPIPQRIAVPDWYNEINARAPGKTHGNAWFSYMNNPQQITDEYLTNMQREGYADGGQTRNYARGGLAHLGAA